MGGGSKGSNIHVETRGVHSQVHRPSLSALLGYQCLLQRVDRNRYPNHDCGIEAVLSPINLPIIGSFPNIVVNKLDPEKTRIPLCIPPLHDYDPRFSDWAEHLWDRSLQRFCTIGYSVANHWPLEPFCDIGQKFFATSTVYTAVLEDLGVVTKRSVMETLEVNDLNKRRFMEMCKSTLKLYEFTYVATPPDYHSQMVSESERKEIAAHMDRNSMLGTVIHSLL